QLQKGISMNKCFTNSPLAVFRKMSRLSLLIFAFALPVMAQKPIIEYGQPDELRGVTKVFVDTGVDAHQRELVVNEIQKQLPDLQIVSRPEESDIHLRIFLKETREGKAEGMGAVVKLIGGNRERVLCSFTDNLSLMAGRGWPTQVFARESF